MDSTTKTQCPAPTTALAVPNDFVLSCPASLGEACHTKQNHFAKNHGKQDPAEVSDCVLSSARACGKHMKESYQIMPSQKSP